MSANELPPNLPARQGLDSNAVGFPQGWPMAAWGAPATAEEPGIPWARYVAALRRYKWMILAIVIAGTIAGVGATRFMAPEYQVQGTVWINANTPQNRGPVRGEELLNAGAWSDLLKSSTIMDRVVQRMSLYLWPTSIQDTAAFAGFEPGPGFRSGTYELKVDPSGTRYTLAMHDGTVVESGAVGDSIGRRAGFLWAPTAAALGRGRTIEFTVANPRDVSAGLLDRLDVTLPQGSAFLKLTLTGRSPHRTASILNAVMNEFVATAGELKRRNLSEEAATLASQLDSANKDLHSAESAFESFRTNTITLPTDAGAVPAPAAGGGVGLGVADGGGNPIHGNYFMAKAQLDALQRDIDGLQLLEHNPASISSDAFIGIPSARLAPELQNALAELSKREAALAAARETYTDAHPTVQNLRASVQVMRTQTIPTLLHGLVTQLRAQAAQLQQQVNAGANQLKQIPPRTIQQIRLARDLQMKANLYTMLQGRYQEISLAEASATPDISILDTAVAPLIPTKNTAPSIIALALLASLGGAVGLALLLDHTDTRFRYPDQVTRELGLSILGAVPSIKRVRGGDPDPEEAAQIIESFRAVRLAITNSSMAAGPIAFTVSSPGAGDGKSLVSSNLALSFAEAGYRTVLVDGDTRRGQLHAMFGANRRPGLLDYLGGEAPLEAVLRETTHEKLALIPCGTRRHRGPELLHSQAMLQLMADLRARYDVILVDSPPLGAGVDPFVLGAATGSMLVVLRTGTTDRKMAEAKLKLIERLPIRVLGAVLNDIRAQGVYRYYTYLYGYTTSEDDEMPRLAPQVGELTEKV